MTCFLIWKLISVHASNRKMLKYSVLYALHFLETFFSFHFLFFFSVQENRRFLKAKWLVHCLCLSLYIFMALFYFCFNVNVSDANQFAAVYLIISSAEIFWAVFLLSVCIESLTNSLKFQCKNFFFHCFRWNRSPKLTIQNLI